MYTNTPSSFIDRVNKIFKSKSRVKKSETYQTLNIKERLNSSMLKKRLEMLSSRRRTPQRSSTRLHSRVKIELAILKLKQVFQYEIQSVFSTIKRWNLFTRK
jgi:hypothetical protein